MRRAKESTNEAAVTDLLGLFKGGSRGIATFAESAFTPSPGWREGELVRRARAGDTDAAREVLALMAGTLQGAQRDAWGHLYPCATYLASALAAVLVSEDAAIALGIKSSKPGRRRGTVTHDPQALGAAYYLLVSRGMPKKAAKQALVDETGADEKTLRSAISEADRFKYPALYPDQDEYQDALQAAAAPIKEKISKILARKRTS